MGKNKYFLSHIYNCQPLWYGNPANCKFYIYMYKLFMSLDSLHYCALPKTSIDEKIWILFWKIKFHLDENIECHCMQLEFNSIGEKSNAN